MRGYSAARASNLTFALSMRTSGPQLTQSTLSLAPECTVSGEAQCGQLKACLLYTSWVDWHKHRCAPGAVSYTHLDVYKRQLLACLRGCNQTHVVANRKARSESCLCLFGKWRQVIHAPTALTFSRKLSDILAVSYTHLLDMRNWRQKQQVRVGLIAIQPRNRCIIIDEVHRTQKEI